jgi:hypothetical protein
MSLIKLRLDISHLLSTREDNNFSVFSAHNFAKKINPQFEPLQISAQVIKIRPSLTT